MGYFKLIFGGLRVYPQCKKGLCKALDLIRSYIRELYNDMGGQRYRDTIWVKI